MVVLFSPYNSAAFCFQERFSERISCSSEMGPQVGIKKCLVFLSGLYL